jgi:hypothetical protein
MSTNSNGMPKLVMLINPECVTRRGFEMVKGVDYEDNFSPTTDISVTRTYV